jgi:lia operon protein LiaG
MKFNIKKFLIILACITIVSFIISGIILYATGGISAVSIKTTQIMKSEVFDVSKVNKVIINTVETDISVIPVVDKKIGADFYGNAKTNLAGALPELKTELDKGVLTIEISYPVTITIGLINLSELHLDIYIPDNFSKEIEVNTVSGNLDIRRFNLESFTFKSTSGDIGASKLASETIKIETTSGKVSLNDAEGSIKINTISGDVDLSLKSFRYNLDIKTTSGEVGVRIPEESKFEFSLGSVSGNIKNEFKAKITFVDEKNLEGSVGEGIYKISIKSISGDINLLTK